MTVSDGWTTVKIAFVPGFLAESFFDWIQNYCVLDDKRSDIYPSPPNTHNGTEKYDR